MANHRGSTIRCPNKPIIETVAWGRTSPFMDHGKAGKHTFQNALKLNRVSSMDIEVTNSASRTCVMTICPVPSNALYQQREEAKKGHTCWLSEKNVKNVRFTANYATSARTFGINHVHHQHDAPTPKTQPTPHDGQLLSQRVRATRWRLPFTRPPPPLDNTVWQLKTLQCKLGGLGDVSLYIDYVMPMHVHLLLMFMFGGHRDTESASSAPLLLFQRG